MKIVGTEVDFPKSNRDIQMPGLEWHRAAISTSPEEQHMQSHPRNIRPRGRHNWSRPCQGSPSYRPGPLLRKACAIHCQRALSLSGCESAPHDVWKQSTPRLSPSAPQPLSSRGEIHRAGDLQSVGRFGFANHACHGQLSSIANPKI